MAGYIRLGTRPSQLAIKQAEEIKQHFLHINFQIIPIMTKGDKDKITPLIEQEDSNFFTYEIEKALLEGKIDAAVHSAKDMERNIPKELPIIATTRSISPFECLISKGNLRLRELPSGAIIGTSSRKRRNAILSFRKDLIVKDIRGNVDERIKQVDKGDFDAIVVAHAALLRLGYTKRIAEIISPDIIEPHPLQGKLVVQVKKDRQDMVKLFRSINETKTNTVYIVGAGPGDPELITVRGLKVLREADCVLYDFLSNSELLNYTKNSCEKICVGKSDGLHLKEQYEINNLLWKKAHQHEKVVRLKGGDPFIFSRGYEEMKFLRNKGINVEVIPGITSAIAGPESFGIPLTVKGKISSVAVVTGRKNDINALIDAPNCDTLIYLMAVANISNVVRALRENGWNDKTPCAFVERATHKNSRIVRATIGTIEQETINAKVKPPAILIIGEVVNYDKHVGSNTEIKKENYIFAG